MPVLLRWFLLGLRERLARHLAGNAPAAGAAAAPSLLAARLLVGLAMLLMAALLSRLLLQPGAAAFLPALADAVIWLRLLWWALLLRGLWLLGRFAWGFCADTVVLGRAIATGTQDPTPWPPRRYT